MSTDEALFNQILEQSKRPEFASLVTVDENERQDIQEFVQELKQREEYYSNCDVEHLGDKLLDRDEMSFLTQQLSITCPHIPRFNHILKAFDHVMPPPIQSTTFTANLYGKALEDLSYLIQDEFLFTRNEDHPLNTIDPQSSDADSLGTSAVPSSTVDDASQPKAEESQANGRSSKEINMSSSATEVDSTADPSPVIDENIVSPSEFKENGAKIISGEDTLANPDCQNAHMEVDARLLKDVPNIEDEHQSNVLMPPIEVTGTEKISEEIQRSDPELSTGPSSPLVSDVSPNRSLAEASDMRELTELNADLVGTTERTEEDTQTTATDIRQSVERSAVSQMEPKQVEETTKVVDAAQNGGGGEAVCAGGSEDISSVSPPAEEPEQQRKVSLNSEDKNAGVSLMSADVSVNPVTQPTTDQEQPTTVQEYGRSTDNINTPGDFPETRDPTTIRPTDDLGAFSGVPTTDIPSASESRPPFATEEEANVTQERASPVSIDVEDSKLIPSNEKSIESSVTPSVRAKVLDPTVSETVQSDEIAEEVQRETQDTQKPVLSPVPSQISQDSTSPNRGRTLTLFNGLAPESYGAEGMDDRLEKILRRRAQMCDEENIICNQRQEKGGTSTVDLLDLTAGLDPWRSTTARSPIRGKSDSRVNRAESCPPDWCRPVYEKADKRRYQRSSSETRRHWNPLICADMTSEWRRDRLRKAANRKISGESPGLDSQYQFESHLQEVYEKIKSRRLKKILVQDEGYQLSKQVPDREDLRIAGPKSPPAHLLSRIDSSGTPQVVTSDGPTASVPARKDADDQTPRSKNPTGSPARMLVSPTRGSASLAVLQGSIPVIPSFNGDIATAQNKSSNPPGGMRRKPKPVLVAASAPNENNTNSPEMTDFRNILKKTGRLEHVLKKSAGAGAVRTPEVFDVATGGAPNATSTGQTVNSEKRAQLIQDQPVRPSDVRALFEKKARENDASGFDEKEWWLKQVHKFNKR